MPSSEGPLWVLAPKLRRVGIVCAKSGIGRRRRGEISGDRNLVSRTNGELFSGDGLRSGALRLGGRMVTRCLGVGSLASRGSSLFSLLGASVPGLAKASETSRYLLDHGATGTGGASSLAPTLLPPGVGVAKAHEQSSALFQKFRLSPRYRSWVLLSCHLRVIQFEAKDLTENPGPRMPAKTPPIGKPSSASCHKTLSGLTKTSTTWRQHTEYGQKVLPRSLLLGLLNIG